MDFLYIRRPSLETFLPTLCADGEVSFDRIERVPFRTEHATHTIGESFEIISTVSLSK